MSPLQISLDLNSTHEQMLKQMQLKVFNWCKDHVSIPEPVENPWKKTTNTWTTWKKSPANMATAPIILFGWWLVWTGTFLCFDILRRITPTDFHIFQRGRSTTNQIFYPDDVKPIIIKYDTIHIYIYIYIYCIILYILLYQPLLYMYILWFWHQPFNNWQPLSFSGEGWSRCRMQQARVRGKELPTALKRGEKRHVGDISG